MAKDFYPHADGEKTIFLNNLLAALPSVVATVGLTAADQLAITNAANQLNAALAEKAAKKAASKAATAACLATDKATENVIRKYARRIKVHENYTVAIGEQLAIVPPETDPTGGVAGIRPDLDAVSVLRGKVTMSFAKHGHTGVEIRSKRGAETEFTFLARDVESPYSDTRPNLSEAPETRYYVAQFLDKDTLVGQLSDVLVATVPGLA